jgi:HEXXH motif-containing protein
VHRRAKAPRPDPTLPPLTRALHLSLLLELGARGAVDAPVTLPRTVPWPPLLSTTLRTRVDAEASVTSITFEKAGLRFSTGNDSETVAWPGLALPGAGRLHRRALAYHPLWSRALFATEDTNPLAHVQGHPERPGNRLDLAGHPPEAWTRPLAEAFALVEAHLPLLAQEMRLLVATVVPVGDMGERHHSCSFEEAVGAIYLTRHPSPLMLAEALVHEFQHNKLNALFRCDPLLEDAYAPVHRSPVRPDPRPLHGVLMAVHAFQAVARLYERMSEAGHPLTKGRDWPRRFREVLDANADAARTVLAHGRPTPLGRALLDELARHEAHFDAVRARLVP